MKTEKEEYKDNPKEEKSETSKEESSEEHGQHIVSEEFQHEVLKLVDEYKDSKPCLEFGYRAFSDAQEELRKKEMKKSPKEFSTAQMPT